MRSRLERAALVSVALCAGCAYIPVSAPSAVVRSYEPGQEQTATIGEAIFLVRQARQVPQIVTRAPYNAPFLPEPVPAATAFTAIGENRRGYLLCNPYFARYGHFQSARAGGRISWVGRNGLDPIHVENPDSIFERRMAPSPQSHSFAAELIYSGLAAGIVRAVYREYVGDLARPAFSQELQYDLSQDSTIAYRTVRIRVLSATNTHIRFRVVEDGGLAWLPPPGPDPNEVNFSILTACPT